MLFAIKNIINLLTVGGIQSFIVQQQKNEVGGPTTCKSFFDLMNIQKYQPHLKMLYFIGNFEPAINVSADFWYNSFFLKGPCCS